MVNHQYALVLCESMVSIVAYINSRAHALSTLSAS